MLIYAEDAQWLGLKTKLVVAYIRNFPAGCSIVALCKEFGVDRVGNNLDAILELALALELLTEDFDGDERILKAMV